MNNNIKKDEWVEESEDERISLIDQERIVETLIDSKDKCYKKFPAQIEKAYLEQVFNENYFGFKFSLITLSLISIFLVFGNLLLTSFDFVTHVVFAFKEFSFLWVACALVYFVTRSESYSGGGNQLHIGLLAFINALVYSISALKFESSLAILFVVFFMMLTQSILLLGSGAGRGSSLLNGLVCLIIFNASHNYFGQDQLLHLESSTFSESTSASALLLLVANIIIFSMTLMVAVVNGIYEINRRKSFLSAYIKRLQEYVPSNDDQKVSQLFPLQPSYEKNHRKLVSVDPITGVSNAKSFSRYLKEEWRCAYSARQSLALMIIDLGIPSMLINDEKESDKIIRLACDEMKRFARRSGDLVGRYDNEKFAILLVNTDLENARKLAEKLLQLLQQTFEPIRAQHKTIDQHSKQVGINIGVASALPMPGIGSDDLVFRAEQALKGALKKNIAGK